MCDGQREIVVQCVGDVQVDATGALSGTRGSERREPDVEEIARKEYRGCPLEKIG